MIRNTSLPVGVVRSRPSWTRDEGPAGGGDAVDLGEAVDQRAAEAVELGDDDALAEAGLDPLDRDGELGPVGAGAALVELDEDLADGGPVKGGPSLDLLSLDGGRDEALASPAADLGDADVAVEDHGLTARSRPQRARVTWVGAGQVLLRGSSGGRIAPTMKRRQSFGPASATRFPRGRVQDARPGGPASSRLAGGRGSAPRCGGGSAPRCGGALRRAGATSARALGWRRRGGPGAGGIYPGPPLCLVLAGRPGGVGRPPPSAPSRCRSLAYFLPVQGRTNSVVRLGPPSNLATACACSLPSGHLAVRMLTFLPL